MLTKAPLHKLKWVLHSEKSVEKIFEFGPIVGPGCHLESWAHSWALWQKSDKENMRKMAKNGPKTEPLKNFKGPKLLK